LTEDDQPHVVLLHNFSHCYYQQLEEMTLDCPWVFIYSSHSLLPRPLLARLTYARGLEEKLAHLRFAPLFLPTSHYCSWFFLVHAIVMLVFCPQRGPVWAKLQQPILFYFFNPTYTL
jgi:hypothetical protein